MVTLFLTSLMGFALLLKDNRNFLPSPTRPYVIWPLPTPLTLCSTIFSSFFTPHTLAFFMFLDYVRLFPTLRPLHLLLPPMRYSAPSQDSFWSFRSQLKDHLFSEAFPDLSIQISMLPPSHSQHLALSEITLFICYLLIVFLCVWNVNFMRTAHYCISRIQYNAHLIVGALKYLLTEQTNG